MAITKERLAGHFGAFDQSLKAYPEKYRPIFFSDPTVEFEHFVYLCPLCLKAGIVCAEQIGTGFIGEFSVDHFPPKSVGGKWEILVCKNCNDMAGHSFESALRDRLAEWSFAKRVPSAVMPVRSRIEGLDGRGFNGFLRVDDAGEMVIDFKRNPKDAIRPVDEWVNRVNQGAPWSAEVTVRTADDDQVNRALLKAAYLHCFLYWGYAFVFSETGERMREVIRGERKYPIAADIIRIDNDTPVQAVEGIPLGVCRLISPSSINGFMVSMALQDAYSGHTVVVLVPVSGPEPESWENLPKLLHAICSAGTLTLEHVQDRGLANGILDGYLKT